MDSEDAAPADRVRLDQWLWAARWFKTRGLAVAACRGGHVKVDKASCKPSRAVRVGEEIQVRKGDREHTVRVLGISTRRGPAPEARLLYEDLTPPETLTRRSVQPVGAGEGRPTKRDRRRRGKVEGW